MSRDPKVPEVLELLKLYATTHFRDEEGFLERLAGYPDLSLHRRAHRQFVAHLDRIVLDPRADDLLEFVRDWLLRHFLGIDRKYLPFVAAQCPTELRSKSQP